MTIIEDFKWNTCEFIRFELNYYRYSWNYDNFNEIITYELVLGRIFNYDPNMQNYHFTLRDDFLGLISKNYYEIIFTWISWLRNLFYNLTGIYA